MYSSRLIIGLVILAAILLMTVVTIGGMSYSAMEAEPDLSDASQLVEYDEEGKVTAESIKALIAEAARLAREASQAEKEDADAASEYALDSAKYLYLLGQVATPWEIKMTSGIDYPVYWDSMIGFYDGIYGRSISPRWTRPDPYLSTPWRHRRRGRHHRRGRRGGWLGPPS